MLLRRQGWQLSTPMAGRCLAHLKARGVLKEPLGGGISTRKRRWRRSYAIRKPKGYAAKQPGDLVPVGTLDVRPLPGAVLKHFTARDVVSHWDGVEAHTRVIATTPPRSLKLNGAVERSQRTHTEESYEIVDFLLGGGYPEPGAPRLGAHLQHGPASPGSALPHPVPIRLAMAIPAKGARVSLITWTSTYTCQLGLRPLSCTRRMSPVPLS